MAPSASRPSGRSKDDHEDDNRTHSDDLTGEEQGREPVSQSSDEAQEAAVVQTSMAPQEVAVPVDVALDVEELDSNLFRSKSLWQPARARGVFGGQVIGMGVASASKTVREDMTLHSLHCYFLLAGNRNMPIIYKVVRVRDGGSYCTRQVEAQQKGRCIFTMLLSYQVPEPKQGKFAIPLPDPISSPDNEASSSSSSSSSTHQPTASAILLPRSSTFTRSPTPNSVVANLPSPEDSPLMEQRYIDILKRNSSKLSEKAKSLMSAVVRDRQKSPVEIRNALPGMYDEKTSLPTEGYEQAFWLRTREPVSGGREAQKAALAYASDFQFLSTIPKALGNSTRISMMASLDHSMWLYEDFDINDYLLFVMQAQAAGSGRGVVLGRIYRRDGALVAVLAQEGMIREKIDRDDGPKL